jgi:hypothetical protein
MIDTLPLHFLYMYLHFDSRRGVPYTFSSDEVGIHMFLGTRLDDLHPLPSEREKISCNN